MNTNKYQQGSFWLTTILLLVIVGMIALLLTPVLTDVQSFASRFGFKSRTELKQDVVKANTNLQIAGEENKNLEAKIVNQAASGVASVTAVDTRHKVDESIDKKATELKEKQRLKMESFDSKVVSKPVVNQAQLAKSQEIAVAQIDSLWNSYCTFNEHPKCATVVNG